MNGIDSVKKVLDYFRDHSEEQGNMEAVDGCYGKHTKIKVYLKTEMEYFL